MPNDNDLLKTAAMLDSMRQLIDSADKVKIGPDRVLVALIIFAGSSAKAAHDVMGDFPFDTMFHEEEWRRMLEGMQSLNELFAPYMERVK